MLRLDRRTLHVLHGFLDLTLNVSSHDYHDLPLGGFQSLKPSPAEMHIARIRSGLKLTRF
ncbi:MAG: hypothetical protein ABL931_06170 [Usitatibacteraceae bacterium]